MVFSSEVVEEGHYHEPAGCTQKSQLMQAIPTDHVVCRGDEPIQHTHHRGRDRVPGSQALGRA